MVATIVFDSIDLLNGQQCIHVQVRKSSYLLYIIRLRYPHPRASICAYCSAKYLRGLWDECCRSSDFIFQVREQSQVLGKDLHIIRYDQSVAKNGHVLLRYTAEGHFRGVSRSNK
jgi:hypothetical protein